MSLIPEIGGLTYAVVAGAAVGTVSKMIPPEIQRNSYRFMAISLASVILSRSFERLITMAMGEEDKDASLDNRLTRSYIKLLVPAISSPALVYLYARSGRIAEEPLTVVTVSFTATFVHFISRQIISQLTREEPEEYKEAEAPAAAPAQAIAVYAAPVPAAAMAAQAVADPAAINWQAANVHAAAMAAQAASAPAIAMAAQGAAAPVAATKGAEPASAVAKDN